MTNFERLQVKTKQRNGGSGAEWTRERRPAGDILDWTPIPIDNVQRSVVGFGEGVAEANEACSMNSSILLIQKRNAGSMMKLYTLSLCQYFR